MFASVAGDELANGFRVIEGHIDRIRETRCASICLAGCAPFVLYSTEYIFCEGRNKFVMGRINRIAPLSHTYIFLRIYYRNGGMKLEKYTCI